MSVGQGFLLDEDNALKQHLKGLQVSTQNGSKTVGVWFRLPEGEERTVEFPYITIDLLDIEEDSFLSHRGRIKPGYTPGGYTAPPEGSDHKTEYPIPVRLTYGVTTHARSSWHDRQLQSLLVGNKFPFRFGHLFVPTGVEGELTSRRLDLVDVQQRDVLDANRKRLFRKLYMVRINAELFPDAIVAVKQVTSITLNTFYQLEPFVVEQVGP